MEITAVITCNSAGFMANSQSLLLLVNAQTVAMITVDRATECWRSVPATNNLSWTSSMEQDLTIEELWILIRHYERLIQVLLQQLDETNEHTSD